MKRVFIVANPGKHDVAGAVADLMPWLSEQAEVIGTETDCDHDLSRLQADFILVLGGDGTLLGAARRLKGRQIPLMGVNFGRLGFLASFTPESFKFYLHLHLAGEDGDTGPEGLGGEGAGREESRRGGASGGLPVKARLVLDVSVLPPGAGYGPAVGQDLTRHHRFNATALNDAVVTAGPPFHMVELEISADEDGGIKYFGDGVIVSTASGSTAYNVSAGGPIIDADVEAFCITPICPHGLSFRPVVISSHSTVVITASRVNEGTTIFCDGQASTRLLKNERVVIRRGEQPVLLLENPDSRPWRSLAEKLNWAVGPRYNGEA
jgi:NAD+ kinase